MASFSLRRAVGGLGQAAADIGQEMATTEIRKRATMELEEIRAKVQAERDARLSELQEGVQIRAEERKKKEGMEIGAEAEAARKGMVDDLSGTVRPRTALEGAEAEAGVYRKRGMLDAALKVEGDEKNRAERAETRLDTRADRNADNDRADRQLAEQKRHNQAVETRAQKLLDNQIENMGLERTIKQMQVNQAKEVEKYRGLATSEKDPTKRAEYREMYQLLTGKDNDNFVVSVDKSKDGLNNEVVRGIIKTDKRSGKVVYEPISGLRGDPPYQEGERLRSKRDGKEYVVENGVPVLVK
jgi:hypothetical protein